MRYYAGVSTLVKITEFSYAWILYCVLYLETGGCCVVETFYTHIFYFKLSPSQNSRLENEAFYFHSRKNLVNLVSFWVLKRSNSSQRYKNHLSYIWFISYLGNILYLKTIVGNSIKLWVCARTMKSLKLAVAQRRRRSVELSGKSSCAIILTKHFHMKIMNSARFKQLGTCWRM